jgi:tricarballylate dehydrogenase
MNTTIDTGTPLAGPWDAIVVGHGFSGLCAALAYLETARREDRTGRVAVLEQSSFEDRGGSTRWTTANLSLTRDRKLRPFWGERVRQTAGVLANNHYIDAFYRLVPDTLDWLELNGISIAHRETPANEEGAWNVVGGGASLINSFPQKIADAGGSIFYDITARTLLRDDTGRVSGLVVTDAHGRSITMKTDAVVLASGGFEGNHEMLTRYIPNAYRLKAVSPGTQRNRGDGIRMAVEIGAGTAGQFDGAHIEPCDPRSDAVEPLVTTYRWGILVNRDAERFIDEAADLFEIDFDTIANTILREQGNLVYAINDSAQRRAVPHFDRYNVTDQPPITADTLEELAVLIGLDPLALRRTVDEFNASIDPDREFDAGVPLDGKHTTGLLPQRSNSAAPLNEGPFLAWPVSGQICFTYGGLSVDGDARVLDTAGRPIAGLYAAGEIAGIFYEQYPAGTSGLRSMTFGRQAGIVAAEQRLATERVSA